MSLTSYIEETTWVQGSWLGKVGRRGWDRLVSRWDDETRDSIVHSSFPPYVEQSLLFITRSSTKGKEEHSWCYTSRDPVPDSFRNELLFVASLSQLSVWFRFVSLFRHFLCRATFLGWFISIASFTLPFLSVCGYQIWGPHDDMMIRKVSHHLHRGKGKAEQLDGIIHSAYFIVIQWREMMFTQVWIRVSNGLMVKFYHSTILPFIVLLLLFHAVFQCFTTAVFHITLYWIIDIQHHSKKKNKNKCL